MNPTELNESLRAFSMTYTENVGAACIAGAFKDKPMNEGQLQYSEQRLTEIGNLLPQVEATLEEATEIWEEYVRTQAPRNWGKLWERFEKEKGAAFKARISGLKEERQAIQKAIRTTGRLIEQGRREELQAKADRFNKRIKGITDALQRKPEWADAVTSLLPVAGGSTLEELGRSLAQTIQGYEDLHVLKRDFEDQGIKVDEIPELDLTVMKEIVRGVGLLLGKPIEVKRNRKISRLRADQRGADLDRAALG